MGGLPQSLHQGATSGTQLAGVTLPKITFVGIMEGWVPRFLRQISTWEEPVCNSAYVAVGTKDVNNWGPLTGSVSTWTHMRGPQISVLPWTFTVQNRGIVTF